MIKLFKKLFHKREPCITEFSKWVVRAVINIVIFIVAFSVIIISAETYISLQSIANDNYSTVTIDLPSLIDFATEALRVVLGYICAAAFVNRKKIDKGFNPNYDDKFQPPTNNDAP